MGRKDQEYPKQLEGKNQSWQIHDENITHSKESIRIRTKLGELTNESESLHGNSLVRKPIMYWRKEVYCQ